jgi:hypothetical protein
MKLIGSRARESHDAFSDWDHVAETEQDVVAIEEESSTWLCHTQVERGSLLIITAVTPDGLMHDYDIPRDHLRLPCIAAAEMDEINRFWIDNFRGLKAIARAYSLLFDMGLERCCGYLRGEMMKRELGTHDICTFYAYGQHSERIASFEETVVAATGLPYGTWAERVHKLRALIRLFESIFGHSREITSVFETRLQEALDASKALLSDAEYRARER